jgi:serine/threonine protein kinase
VLGVQIIHQNNFIHRDLKSENILLHDLNEDKIVKILDFEYCRSISATDLANTYLGFIFFIYIFIYDFMVVGRLITWLQK